MLLTGEPGSGKTAFMAWLARRTPDSLRYFIRRDSRTALSSGDAQSLLLSLGHQLASRRPALFRPERLEVVVEQHVDTVEAGGRASGIRVADLEVSPFYTTALHVEQHAGRVAGELEGISVGRMVTAPRLLEPALLQFLALLDPATLLGREDPDARLLIFIDALDELRYHPAAASALDWLAACPALPANVRVVLASRPDEDLLAAFRGRQRPGLREVPIVAGSEAARRDVLCYARSWAVEPSHTAIFAGEQRSPDSFSEAVAQRADGNFQYVVALLRALEAADRRTAGELLRMTQLPPGLGELYSFFLRLLREAVRDERIALGATGDEGYVRAWDGVYRPVLAVMAVARAPLTVAELSTFGPGGVEPAAVAEAIGRLGQFLDREDDRLRLYHASFSEYLTAASTRDSHPADHIDSAAWHRRLGLLAAQSRDAEGYGLRHAVEHLALSLSGRDDAKVRERLMTVVADLGYAEVKTSMLGIDALLGDLRLADEALGSGGGAGEALRVYGQEAHNLRGRNVAEQPAGFAQGVHNRAVTLGYDTLARAAKTRLAKLRVPYLLLRWRTLRDSPALVSTLRGHESWAVYVVLLAEGRRAVSAGRDGTVRGWDLRTGRQLWRAQVGHEHGDIWRLAVTPDGRRVVVSGAPPAVIDANTGEVLRPLRGYRGGAGSIAVLADGRRVATAQGDGVAIWALDSDEPPEHFGGFGGVTDLAAVLDGRLGILDAAGETLTVIDPSSGEVSVLIEGLGAEGGSYATALAMSGNGRRAIVTRDSAAAMVLDLVGGRIERRLDRGDESVFSAAITPDGRRGLVGADPTVTLWDLDSGRKLRELSGHSSQVRGVALTADAAFGVSAGADDDLRVWDLVEAHPSRFERGHTYSVNGVALSADGSRGASASVDSLVKVFDVVAGRVLHTFSQHSGIVRDVAVFADGSRVVSAGLDRTVRQWNVAQGSELGTFEDHKHWVTEVAVDSDGTIVSGSHDRTVRAGPLRSGVLHRGRSVLFGDFAVEALALSDDGVFVVVGGGQRVVRIRRSDGEVIDELPDFKQAVSNVAVEPGSRRVLVSGNDGSLVLWEPAAEIVRHIPPPCPSKAFPAAGSGGHRGDAAAAFVAPGIAAVARAHGVLEMMDIDSEVVLAAVPLDHPPVSVAAVPGGATVLVGDRGGDVHCLEWFAAPHQT